RAPQGSRRSASGVEVGPLAWAEDGAALPPGLRALQLAGLVVLRRRSVRGYGVSQHRQRRVEFGTGRTDQRRGLRAGRGRRRTGSLLRALPFPFLGQGQPSRSQADLVRRWVAPANPRGDCRGRTTRRRW